VYAVTPTQISAIVPYAASGSTATVIITVNGIPSNSVEVPLAATAPGIFSLTQNGLGDGAILHPNYSLVNALSPAAPGEIIQVYLTGLGAVSPAVADGAAAPINPLAQVVSPILVTIDGVPCVVHYNGLAPTLAGLYQLNIEVPRTLGPGRHSLAIQTVEGFTDMVDVRVGD
jgi:uncharacterized protein (TIGR03437 family)